MRVSPGLKLSTRTPGAYPTWIEPGQVTEDGHQLSELSQRHVVRVVKDGGQQSCVGNQLGAVVLSEYHQGSND